MPKRRNGASRQPGKPGAPTSDKIYLVNLLTPAHFNGSFFELQSGKKVPVRCACHKCLPAIKREGLINFENPLAEQSQASKERREQQEARAALFHSFMECWRRSPEKLRVEYCLARDVVESNYPERVKLYNLATLAESRGVPPPTAVGSPEAVELCNHVIMEFNGLVEASA